MCSSILPSRINRPHATHKRYKSGRIVVIGGGITGLSSAHRLQELGLKKGIKPEVILLEGSGKLGGVISSKSAGGLLIEEGPDSFVSSKPWALDLCRRIGLEPDLIGSDDEARRVFVVIGRRLVPVPEGFLLTPTRLMPFVASPLFTWRGKLRMSLDTLLPRRNSGEDESVGDFITRRLGREALNRFVQPVLGGIYGGNPGRLSTRATMPHLVQMEEKYRSLILGMRKQRISEESGKVNNGKPEYGQFISLKNGMRTLTEELASKLNLVSIHLNTAVIGITRIDNRWKIKTENNEIIDCDGVIIATPAGTAGGMVEELDPVLARELSGIKYSSPVVINLIYNRADIAHPLDGHGFVVPASEGLPIMACSFSSVKFGGRAPREKVILRCFISDAADHNISETGDSTIVDTAHNSLNEILDIRSGPVFETISRYRRSMPQYEVGHLERISRINSMVSKYPGLMLAGNAYEGIGIPDCVRTGEKAAGELFDFIRTGEGVAS